MNDVERLVQAEIDRLKGPGFSKARRARQMRNATIRALAEATVANKPWTGPEGVLGPKRPSTIVSETNFYEKAHWYAHPLVQEVIERVTELYRQRNAAEKEEARQRNRIWVEQREPSIEGATAVFLLAYQRFHFFWVTVLFPWMVAALPWLWRRSAVPPSVKPGPWLAVVAVAGLALCLSRGIFEVSTYYRDTGQARAADIRCFQRQLGTGEPIQCPGSQILRDWTPAYQHARSLGASFVRYLPIVEHEPPAHWLLDWPRTPARGQLQWRQLTPVSGGPDFTAGEDPQIVFTSSDHQAFEQCRVLEVQLRLRPSAASQAQVFVQPRGSAGFSETHSRIKPVAAFAEPIERHFVFDSPNGFEPVLRIDPVDGIDGVELHALRVSCRLSAVR